MATQVAGERRIMDAHNQDNTNQRPRWMTGRAKVFIAGVLLVMLCLMAAIPWYLSSPRMMTRITKRLLPELQASVTFERVRVGWFGPIQLDGIAVKPNDGTDAPLLMSRLEVSSGFGSILCSGGNLGLLRIEGLKIDVTFDKNRNSNLQNLFLKEATPVATDPPHSKPRRSIIRMQVVVDDAQIQIRGPWANDPWTSDPIDIRATLGPADSGPYSQWSVAPVQLLNHAKLKPSVASGVLAYIAPILADATRTGGEFSLRINGATIPVGDPAEGTLAGVLAMHTVEIGPGPLAVKTLQELPLGLPPPPVIQIADNANVDFRLGDRRIWHTGLEFGIPLKKPGMRLDIHSSGSVGLDDDSLDLKLELPIPAELPQDRPVIASLAGRKISIGVGGTLLEPKLQFDGSLRDTATAALLEVIERLRRPGSTSQRNDATVLPHGTPPVDKNARAPKNDTMEADPSSDANKQPPSLVESLKSTLPAEVSDDPTADAVIDLVGDVLKEVAKRRAEKRAAEAQDGKIDQPRGLFGRRPKPAPVVEKDEK